MKNKILLLIYSLCLGYSSYSQTISASVSVLQAPCNNDGSFKVSITGGIAPYTITYGIWNTGAQIVHSGVLTDTDTFTNWNGGGCSIMITDANNAEASITQTSQYPFTAQYSVTNVQCPSTPGAITVYTSGGNAPFTYQCFNAIDPSTVISTTNPALVNDEGVYKIIVTDASGCTYSVGNFSSGTNLDSTGIYVNATAPFEFDVTTTAASCNNGTATPTAITGSGIPPYSYEWSNGSTSSTGLTGLMMGSYWLKITDANGCHFTRNFYISQSINIEVPITKTDVTCLENDGNAIAFGSGGMPPYAYQWSNGQNTQTISNLSAGSYTVIATDANGCIGFGSTYLNATTPITVTYTTTPSSCTAATGSATLNITGGSAPYTVSWSTFPTQSGTTASNLLAGNYSFHVTEANGCVQNGTITIPQQNHVSVVLSALNPTCTASNGSINTIVGGTGTAPYTYLWNTGATTNNLSGLSAGFYHVIVTDANGCSGSGYKYLQSTSPVYVGIATTPVSCAFSDDGSITASPSGGTAPYTYAWSNNLGTTASVSNVGAGYYNVTVTDANGCVSNANAIVQNNESSNSCYCTITGTVYNDVNGNCTQDAGENGIQNIGIHCQGFGTAYTDANGVYTFHVPSGNYVISENVLAYYPLAPCQNNINTVSVTASAGCSQTIDFANVTNPIHDLKIALWNNSFPVPGNAYTQQLQITNMGTTTESTTAASYKNDGQLGAATITPSTVFTNGGSNWFPSNIGSLTILPGQTKLFNIDYNVPTNIPMNTGLTFYDSVATNLSLASNWMTDYSPWNNVNTVNQTVVSSYDPNFIEVSPQGVTQDGNIEYKDSLLQYRIHFQNSGTYYAQNITILNPLDGDLDWSTFTPGAGSHPFTTFIDENGVVHFQFDNIHLPWESLTEAGSQGYVTYSIKTKNGLPVGTQFHNKADIYFDYNAPIETNQTVNTLMNPTGVTTPQANSENVFVYPNPSSGEVNMKISSKESSNALINITDISGKVIVTQNQNLKTGTQIIPLNVTGLSSGIYFVTLKANAINVTKKIVIMK